MTQYEQTLTEILFLFYQRMYRMFDSVAESGEGFKHEDIEKLLKKTEKDLRVATKKQTNYLERFGNVL